MVIRLMRESGFAGQLQMRSIRKVTLGERETANPLCLDRRDLRFYDLSWKRFHGRGRGNAVAVDMMGRCRFWCIPLRGAAIAARPNASSRSIRLLIPRLTSK